ncbi:MraY family glycosyltransferase [Allopontixanthobacter confluentis]|nr:glycosyltransferase family 4 protein [Allopontixanthobacter confluentis]
MSRRMVDQVNARSSHTEPTPRGGGISIVVLSLLAILVSMLFFNFPLHWAVGFGGAGILVAAVGWIDDHGHVSASIRFLAHISSAAWVLFWIGPPELTWLGITGVLAPIIGWIGGVLAIGWLVNLFNFMDGIDGLAASETISVTFGGALLLAGATGGMTIALPFILMAAATVGFLRWNWPPARIFMGDAASGFLGLMVGGLILAAWQYGPSLGSAVAILPGVFVADATATLIVRIVQRQRLHEAHRTHAYQHLAIRLGRHRPVTIGVIAVNWLFLFPLACIAAAGLLQPLLALAAAYVPLFASAFALRAGRAEKSSSSPRPD